MTVRVSDTPMNLPTVKVTTDGKIRLRPSNRMALGIIIISNEPTKKDRKNSMTWIIRKNGVNVKVCLLGQRL